MFFCTSHLVIILSIQILKHKKTYLLLFLFGSGSCHHSETVPMQFMMSGFGLLALSIEVIQQKECWLFR